MSNERYDFGSLLRFIERNFAGLGLQEGELGFADSRATTDFSSFFHMAASAREVRRFATVAAPKSAADFVNDTRPPEAPDND